MRGIIIALFYSLSLSAYGALVFIQDGNIYLKVKHPGLLNPRSKKDLTSGLSTKAVILGQILDSSDSIVSETYGMISVKYDLWKEIFFLNIYEDQITSREIEKVIAAFENPRPLRLSPLSGLKKTQLYRVRSIETVNPLDNEKFEAIQKWIIHQKSAVRGLGGGADPSSAPSVPETAFKTLFYSLWKKSNLGDSLPGELRREVVSEPFSVESLKEGDRE